MNIYPAAIDHVTRYGEIYAAAFSGEPWNDPWRPEDAEIHVRELLETKTAYGLEYVENGKVVGFLVGTSMLFHYGRTFEINDLAVDPAYQVWLWTRHIRDAELRGSSLNSAKRI